MLDSLTLTPRRPKQFLSFARLPREALKAENWPGGEISMLEPEEQQRFERLQKGVKSYLSDGRLARAAREASISRTEMRRLILRCLEPSPTGGIIGWLALHKGQRLGDYTRTKPLPDAPSHGTLAGAFDAYLSAAVLPPGPNGAGRHLREALDEFILPMNKDGTPTVTRPTLDRVFAFFKHLARLIDPEEKKYPFTVKSKARRSVERYTRALIAEHPDRSVGTWHGEDAAARLHLGTGQKSFSFAMKPLDAAMVDAHKTDCIGTVTLDGPAGPQAVAISRMWLIVIMDYYSRAILGYSVSIGTEVDAGDVEQAFVCAATPWKPKQITIDDLHYVKGAGLPCGVIPGIHDCRFNVLRLDNASVHYADRIIEGVRRWYGCAITFGSIGGWWRNAVLERFFKTLESRGFQRLTSSTGTGPSDGRKPDSVEQAIRHKVDWKFLIELADVLIANYNATPHVALGNRSPLSVLREGLQT